MVEAGLDERGGLFDDRFRVRPADDGVGDHVGGHELGGLLEMGGSGKILRELTGYAVVGPDVMGPPNGLVAVLCPAEAYLPVARTLAAGLLPGPHDVGGRPGHPQTITDL